MPAKKTKAGQVRKAKAVQKPSTQPAAKAKTARPAKTEGNKLSALEAAAKVLAESGQPLTCREMIAIMAAKGYWTSPGGATPHATLASGILRELQAKGGQARFRKVGPGKFALAK